MTSEFAFYLLTEKVRNGSRHEELGSLSVSFVREIMSASFLDCGI